MKQVFRSPKGLNWYKLVTTVYLQGQTHNPIGASDLTTALHAWLSEQNQQCTHITSLYIQGSMIYTQPALYGRNDIKSLPVKGLHKHILRSENDSLYSLESFVCHHSSSLAAGQVLSLGVFSDFTVHNPKGFTSRGITSSKRTAPRSSTEWSQWAIIPVFRDQTLPDTVRVRGCGCGCVEKNC